MRDKWDTINIKVKCPLGTAYIDVMEDSPGKIYQILMRVGKAGSPVNAMCWAIAAMATELFRCGKGINEMIMLLENITEDRPSVKDKKTGIEVRSIPEALALALRRYRTTIPPKEDNLKVARLRTK